MPMFMVPGAGMVQCEPSEATHVRINMPGPSGLLILPVVQGNTTRAATVSWTWNGDMDKPTLRPSVLTNGYFRPTDAEYRALRSGEKIERRPYRCHTWVNDGQAQFLDDCDHDLRGQTIDMLEVT
jgi:Family of unknown function (DUF6527)